MTIAVDARLFQKDVGTEYGVFVRKLILSLAENYHSHRFILFSDCNIDSAIKFPANVSVAILTPEPTNFFLYKWWYDVKVSSAIKKFKADVFIGTNGLCSLTTSIPQILFIEDFTFRHYPSFFAKNSLYFYKIFTSRFLKKATVIAAFSNQVEQEIVNTYKVAAQKVRMIAVAPSHTLTALEWEVRENVKEKYAQGCEYFLFAGGLNPVNNLVNVLKAFSVFKKWQKSNMKLVVTIQSPEYKDEAEKLNSYKYKNDVILAENLSENGLAHVIAAAYAMIFLPLYEGFGVAVLDAMQAKVPLITSANSSMAEIASDSALYSNPEDHTNIAENMKLIFKDEQLRNRLIALGSERLREYRWNKTIADACLLIQQEVSK